MTEYVIFTDAGADIPAALCAQYDIHGVPMQYLLGGETGVFRPEDGRREDFCAGFYQALRERADISTSQITPFTFEEVFVPVLEEGRDILYCCFSSGLSSTWQNLQGIAEELRERYPDRTLRCIDTRCAAAGQGLLVLQAAVNRAKGMGLEENAQWLECHFRNVCHWFTVDDLDFLKRGGRISPTVAFLGGKLQIKPMLVVMPDGSLQVREKARGRKKSMDRLVELYRENAEAGEWVSTVFVNQAGCPEDGAALVEELRKAAPAGTEFVLVALSPIIGAHTGPNMLSVCHFGKPRSDR